MADTGHVAIRGYKAGAIKYTVLRGYVPNPGSVTLNACITTRGFGNFQAKHRPALRGFTSGGGGGGGTGSGAFEIFTGAIFGVPGMTS